MQVKVNIMRKIALVLACCLTGPVLLAGGPVVETSLFAEGTLPEGWRANANGLVSPTYSNRVTQVVLSYAAADLGTVGTLTLYASNSLPPAEHEIVTLNTRTTRAELDFPENSDYRAFRLATNGVSLASFVATWMDTRLATPTNVAATNNTGSSFDLSWEAVEDAIGYRITIWTNAIVGAAAGVATWQETFAGMGASKTAGLNSERLELADHGGDWRDTPFENGYLIDNGGGIRLGTTTATGWISVPHVVAAGENALRVTAARYSQNKGQQLAVLCVLEGCVTNLVGTFPVDFDGTYPTIDMSNAVDVIELPASAIGGTLILQTTSGTDGKEARIAVKGIEFVSGYSAGTQMRDVFREETISAADTACTIDDLPPVAVQASVQALAANAADVSEASAAVMVDLAHPPPVPQLAVLGSVVAEEGYTENFDALIGLGTSADWADGLTLPYWQACKGEAPVDKISTSYGVGNKTGGLYAYHGTNKNDTASYSLAAVANSSNKMKFGFAVTNDMEGFVLSNFAVSFTARQWTFSSGRKDPQALHFEYLVTNEVAAMAAPSNCWHAVEALRFDATGPGEGTNSLAAAASVGKADWVTGSAFANLEAALEGVAVRSGEVLLLRWRPDPFSNGEVLGVDDVGLTCERHSTGLRVRVVSR